MKTHLLQMLVAALAATPLAAQWGVVPTTGTPSPRNEALLAYDLPGNRLLLFGGNWSNELYSLQNGTFTLLQPATSPSPRSRTDIATDTFTGTILLYGGSGSNSRYALDETWQWSGNNWTLLSPSTSPGGLARHSLAFDLVRQTTVLFGGRYDSWAQTTAFDQTWEFSNGDWARAFPLASPPARINGALAYHPARAEIVLFGGENGQGQGLADTWSYDGITWTQINTTGPQPAARSGAQLVPIIVRNLLVLAGGRDPVSMQILNDTWEHDGQSWHQVNNVYGGMYPPRDGVAMAEDIARNRIVAFGGRISNNSLRSDTWEYGAQWQPFGVGCTGSSGVPTLTGTALPNLGMTCTAEVGNMPASTSLALMAVGLSRQQWALGTLPALLTSFGMPGCRAYVSADAITALVASGGVAQWSWNVPNQPAFVGQAFHLQGLVLDANANAGGATVSNAATIVLGW